VAKNGRSGRRGRQGRGRETPRTTVDGGVAELRPDPDRVRAWTLCLDGAPQSHVDLDDPAHLDFAYQRRLGHLADLAAPPGRPLHALHLGGGALTLARYVAATRPRSSQQVIERDAALTRWVRERLPLQRGLRMRVRAGDAREGLGRLPGEWADLIVADVFAGGRTPAHLTTVEFLREVRRVLRPGALYAVNVADGPAGARSPGGGAGDGTGAGRRGAGALSYLRSQVSTLRAEFAHVCLVADPAVLRGRRFGNAVLAASDGELPVAGLTRRAAGDPHPARVEHGAALADFAGGTPAATDATARDSPAPSADVFG
jgi:hypothetical protein